MAAWKELSQFTYGELSEMNLTYADWKDKSIEELLSIAQKKLARFKSIDSEKQGPWKKAVPLLESIVAGVAANLATDAIRSVEWHQLLIETLEFLDKITPK